MAEIIACTPLRNGRNNQVYRLDLQGERNWDNFLSSAQKFGLNLTAPNTPFPPQKTLILKRYFQHPDDLRARLDAEFSFLSFAWQKNIRSIAEPLVCHKKENWALYSFLPGNPVTTATESGVNQALQFFTQLNQNKHLGSHLPKASEGCFEPHDHLKNVERRLSKLIETKNPLLSHFLEIELLPKWNSISKNSSKLPLHPDELCISPSDFGFHNALENEGRFHFLDFEYAGWDDPAKTVCDFFCQPKIPVPMDFFENVSKTIAQSSAHPERCLERIRQSLPACRIKWCCIMLGGLVGAGKARREFAEADEVGQLEKTREYLYAI